MAAGSARTKYEAANDIAYEVRVHERHARLYGKARAVLGFIALAGGASAFTQPFAEMKVLLAVGGVLVAACAFIEHLADLPARIHCHRAMRARWLDLQGRLDSMGLAAIDAEIAMISKDDPPLIDALRQPSQNDALRTRGYEAYVRRLRPLEHVFDWLA